VAETTVHPDSGSASLTVLPQVLVGGKGSIWGFDRETSIGDKEMAMNMLQLF